MKIGTKWTSLYLKYDMIFYKIICTHFFFLSLEVKNIKQQEGERTLIAARSWLRTIVMMN